MKIGPPREMDPAARPQDTGVAPSAAAAHDPGLRLRFQEMFQTELPYVWTSLRRLGVAEADREDVASEVFVSVHRKIADYDPTRPVRPWLFAFCLRAASDYRRLARHRVEVLGHDRDVASTSPGPEQMLERERARDLVARAIETLDLDRRAVFVLHELDEVPVPQIARSLEIPEGTAYTRLRSAREAFARALRALRDGTPYARKAGT